MRIRLLTVTLTVVVLCSYNNLFSADYYWIGGSGNWADISHWATTSGGNLTHAQIPTSDDNVIFDANSFTSDGQTVTLNSENIFFQDLDMSGVSSNMTIAGTSQITINCYGSLILSNNITWNFDGDINLLGELSDNILDFEDNSACRDLYILGSGAWSLQSNLMVNRLFEFHSGSFISSDHHITTKFFNIKTPSAEKNLDLGNSTVEIWGESKYVFLPALDTSYFTMDLRNLSTVPGNFKFEFTASNVELRFSENTENYIGNIHFTNDESQVIIRSTGSFPLDVPIQLDTIRFSGNAEIWTPLSAQYIQLSKNRLYQLESGEEFIFNEIDAQGTCTESITITSTEIGIPSFISSSGAILLSHVTLRDIHGRNGTFQVDQGTDLGNNDNWTFINSDPIDYYWINGSGNWSDPQHWALSSGGAPSGCVPTGKDNVYFDQNSFSSNSEAITLDLENIFVNDFTWNNVNPGSGLAGDKDYNIHIGGSLRFDENMNHSFGGDYYFESSTTGHTIEANNIPFNGNIHFDGVTGGWTFNDDVQVTYYIYLHSGTLISNGNHLVINGFSSRNDNQRTLNIEGSYIKYQSTAGSPPRWWIDGDGCILKANDSTIEFPYRITFANTSEDTLIYNNVIFKEPSSFFTDPLTALTCDSIIAYHDILFDGNCTANYLQVSPGYTCLFKSNGLYDIGEINANGNCENGLVNLLSDISGVHSTLLIRQDLTLQNIFVKDIHLAGDRQLELSQSIDGGNNEGWIFLENGARRTLYWVNNGGDWEDSNHWSLSSGGPGGECIPSANDDVIVDENSFDLPNQKIKSNRTIYIHTLRWDNSFGNPELNSSLNLLGSLYMEEHMSIRSNLYFHTNEIDSVFLSGQKLEQIEMVGSGTLKYISDIRCRYYYQKNGFTILNNINFYARNFIIWNRVSDQLVESYFQDSDIILGRNESIGSFYLERNTKVTPGNSRLIFENEVNEIRLSDVNAEFNQVITTSPTGNIDLNISNNTFSGQSLLFFGNAYLNGKIFTDSLTGTPGKSYTINNYNPLVVHDHLNLIGNNCLSIELKSSTSGQKAEISMPSTATMNVDFVQMRDIRATGEADFYAGNRSTDINNSNEGWIFGVPPDYVEVGFLGPDQVLCDDQDMITLDANNYSPGEQYTWNDGSSASTLAIGNSGSYSVQVDFENNCFVRDTIMILESEDLLVQLPQDTIICENTSFIVDGTNTLENVSYLWQDDDTNPIKEISEAGSYTLTIEKDGCMAMDGFDVMVQELPRVDLGPDQSFCEGGMLTLVANYPGASYLWQDNSQNATIVVDQPGTYWVTTEINQCQSTDSIVITQVNKPVIDLGMDTTICEGENLVISTPEESGVSYQWEDGSDTNSRVVNTQGNYILTADRNGCSHVDSIFIATQVTPTFDLGADLNLCEETPFLLDGTNSINNVDYRWNDGSADPQLSGMDPGTYWLEASVNNCAFRDSVTVTYLQLPDPQLGNDTTLCEGITLILSPQQLDGATFLWQDGSSDPEFTVSQPGEYVVNIDNQGCARADTINIDYQPTPTFDLGPDLNLCEGTLFQLDGTNAISDVDYRWNDGSSDPQLVGMNPGIYWLEASVNHCAFRDSVTVTYLQLPNPQLGNDTTLCEGITLILSPQQLDGATFLWQDGSTELEFTVSQPGQYVVNIDNQGCARADTIQVDYQSTPTFDLGPDLNLCEETPFLLDGTNSINNVDYRWNDGSADPQLSGMNPGTYWLEASVNNCAFRDSVTVTYLQLPNPQLGNDTTLCEGITLILSPQQLDGATFLWQDGSTEPEFIVAQPDQYIVNIDNQGCARADTININYQSTPTFDLGPDLNLCEGTPFQLNGTNAINNVDYMWNDGSSDPQLVGMNPGIYWLEATINSCSFRDSIIVTYLQLPNPQLGNDTTLCEGITLILSPQQLDGATFLWQDGSSDPEFTVSQPGQYVVNIDNQGCASADTINIDYKPSPMVMLPDNDLNLCEGESYQLNAPGGFTEFQWEDGSTSVSRTLTESGVYWIEVTEEGCSDRDSLTISVTTLPVLDLGRDTTVCEDIGFTIIPVASEGQLTWSDGSTGSVYNVTELGMVSATLNNNGCEVEDEVFIGFKTCSRFQAFIPNAFSPNGDGNNDVFVPQFPDGVFILSFRMTIYNRWGNKIYTTTLLDEGWNGRIQNALGASGVYVYVIEVNYSDDFTSGNEVITGDILLMK